MPIRALLIDGQHNHTIWPATSALINRYLKQTGLFTVTICRAQCNAWEFQHSFDGYDVVVLNYNPNPGAGEGPIWPEETRARFEAYMGAGGGLVVLHSANNAFAHWPAYNLMTGIGGWGGRTPAWGPTVYYDQQGQLRYDRDDPCPIVGNDGPPREFVVEHRELDHPILRGLPHRWRHTRDEIYERLRGPAVNLTVLGTAFAESYEGHDHASYRHEPVLMTTTFGQGRVFHTTLGHWSYSLQCAGLITLIQRGTEWAATGEVTQAVPPDFPTEERITYRRLAWDDFQVVEWSPYL